MVGFLSTAVHNKIDDIFMGSTTIVIICYTTNCPINRSKIRKL